MEDLLERERDQRRARPAALRRLDREAQRAGEFAPGGAHGRLVGEAVLVMAAGGPQILGVPSQRVEFVDEATRQIVQRRIGAVDPFAGSRDARVSVV